MSDTTPRYHLPLLSAGQAQKEIAHNEALMLLDQLAQPVVEAMGTTVPPTGPVEGQAWIVGTSPSGAWAGQAGALAIWTAGGWRFVASSTGMQAWVRASGLLARRGASSWTTGNAVADPMGGTVIDAPARAAIEGILAALRAAGLVAA